MGEFFHVGVKMPKGLDVMDFDRKNRNDRSQKGIQNRTAAV